MGDPWGPQTVEYLLCKGQMHSGKWQSMYLIQQGVSGVILRMKVNFILEVLSTLVGQPLQGKSLFSFFDEIILVFTVSA